MLKALKTSTLHKIKSLIKGIGNDWKFNFDLSGYSEHLPSNGNK